MTVAELKLPNNMFHFNAKHIAPPLAISAIVAGSFAFHELYLASPSVATKGTTAILAIVIMTVLFGLVLFIRRHLQKVRPPGRLVGDAVLATLTLAISFSLVISVRRQAVVNRVLAGLPKFESSPDFVSRKNNGLEAADEAVGYSGNKKQIVSNFVAIEDRNRVEWLRREVSAIFPNVGHNIASAAVYEPSSSYGGSGSVYLLAAGESCLVVRLHDSD